jgi:DNA polymerase phi
MPLVFTPNFMRVWINNLGGEERYLHKAALAIAQLVQTVTADNPTAGFTLLSQLLGKNGHRNFDRVTKTKTVSGIMASLSAEGVSDFVAYLQGLLNEAPAATSAEYVVRAPRFQCLGDSYF